MENETFTSNRTTAYGSADYNIRRWLGRSSLVEKRENEIKDLIQRMKLRCVDDHCTLLLDNQPMNKTKRKDITEKIKTALGHSVDAGKFVESLIRLMHDYPEIVEEIHTKPSFSQLDEDEDLILQKAEKYLKRDGHFGLKQIYDDLVDANLAYPNKFPSYRRGIGKILRDHGYTDFQHNTNGSNIRRWRKVNVS